MKAYILIDRLRQKDLAIEYDDVPKAQVALNEDPLVDYYCEEDAVHAYVISQEDARKKGELDNRKIVIAKEQRWLIL